MRQALITPEIAALLPPLCSSDDKPYSEIKVPVKFFSPFSNWTWYLYEYDPENRIFFGLVVGFEKEFGFIALDELESAVKKIGREDLPLIERDAWWDSNTTLAKVCEAESLRIPERRR